MEAALKAIIAELWWAAPVLILVGLISMVCEIRAIRKSLNGIHDMMKERQGFKG